jgi:hypothetical protein
MLCRWHNIMVEFHDAPQGKSAGPGPAVSIRQRQLTLPPRSLQAGRMTAQARRAPALPVGCVL